MVRYIMVHFDILKMHRVDYSTFFWDSQVLKCQLFGKVRCCCCCVIALAFPSTLILLQCILMGACKKKCRDKMLLFEH